MKNCPECGGELKHSHPKKSERTGQILYYRRWSCERCPYYESATINTGWQKRQPLSLVEIENLKDKKAEKYFPKDNMLLKKQMLNLNTRQL
jgi:C4-type Zn-finger protein